MIHNLRLKQIAAGFLLLGMASCGETAKHEGAADSAAKDSAKVAAVADSASTQQKAHDFFQSLPSPLHVANLFKRSGLKYIAGVTNPTDNAAKYVATRSRSLNLGVYSSDLAYATLNNQNKAAIDYFKAVKTLADGLDMSSVFEKNNLIARFEKNISNQDSLIRLMADLHMESDGLLKETQRADVVFLSFAGAWVESLYIATNLTKSAPNPKITDRILQQTNPLSKLIKLLGDIQKKDEFNDLITSLTGIRDSMEAIEKLGKPATDKEFQKKYNTELYPQIETLRNKIINEL